MTMTCLGLVFVVLAFLHCIGMVVDAFSPASFRPSSTKQASLLRVSLDDDLLGEEDSDSKHDSTLFSRRDALGMGVMGTAAFTLGSAANPEVAMAFGEGDEFSPAIRPLAYRVDSTIPPSLLPLNARKEIAILKNLGRGKGTSKEAVIDDRLNFNNMLNKAVFGSIGAVSQVVSPSVDETKSGPGYATFVCLGVPRDTTSEDVDLSVSLLTSIMQGRNSKLDTALGLSFAPLGTQAALDDYVQGGSEQALVDALSKSSVSEATIQLYLPLLRFAKSQSMTLLPMAPEAEDIETVRKEGLQNVNVDRRANYVVDSEGFINTTQDPKFKVYTDRSLIKDFDPASGNQGNFFAERILVHETAATAVARYATSKPDSLVAMVVPTPDVRFMGGINGRIPRVCRYYNNDSNKVNEEEVTTILLNPTAEETLSLSRFLRLEIGTGPDTLKYQSKVADYLWFSKMPKVNMIPRLMNG